MKNFLPPRQGNATNVRPFTVLSSAISLTGCGNFRDCAATRNRWTWIHGTRFTLSLLDFYKTFFVASKVRKHNTLFNSMLTFSAKSRNLKFELGYIFTGNKEYLSDKQESRVSLFNCWTHERYFENLFISFTTNNTSIKF